VIPDKVIKLGVDLPLSGDDAADGKAVRNGIELAVKQSDAIAGYRVQIDAKSDANKITQLPDEDVGSTNIKDFLKDPRVVGIIGPYNSGVALKEIPIVNGHNDKAQRIALVSPSATADCLTTSQYATSYCNDVNHNGAFFRIAALNAKSGETFANCLAAPAAEGRLCPSSSFHKFKTVAIIDDSTPYSVGFAQSFRQYWERNSGTKTALREVSNKAGRGSLENALQGTIADLGDTPDVVFFAGSEENTKLLHQIMQQGRQHDLPDLSRTPFASGASIMDDDFVTYLRAQRHTADVYAAAPIKNIDTPNTSEQKNSQEFITRYREAYGAKPTPYAAAGYDAANIIIQAIQAAAGKMDMPTPGNSQSLQDFRDKVIFGIKNPVDDSVAGVTGRYAFNEQGDFKDAAVSVFRWDPSNSNNQNGWDYQ
jgi:branched-chain amino acid transport system substrate-binding protein